MVREVVHDVLFLGQKSEPATQADKQVERSRGGLCRYGS